MPLPLTVSCSSKIQIGFTCQVPAHLGSPGKGPLNWYVCVCVCVPVVEESDDGARNERDGDEQRAEYSGADVVDHHSSTSTTHD